MAAESLLSVHSRFQSLADRDALVLFGPLVAAAALVAILIVRRIWRHYRQASQVLVAGALAWAIALVLDASFERNSPFGIAENTLELLGSALFLIALLLVVKQVQEVRDGDPRLTVRP